MAKLRAAIIGCGFISPAHLGGYAKLDQVEVVGFCDLLTERAEEKAAKFGAPGAKVFSDYQKMLDEVKPDIVSVCTENNKHCELTVAALESGAHVLCEKPMAITGAEADKMVAAAKKAGKKLSVGYQLRYTNEAMLLRREIEAGKLGKVYYAEAAAVRRRGVPTWGVFLNKEKQGGGPLIDIGTHLVDRTLWLMDEYSPIVSAVGNVYDHLIPLGGYNNGGPWDIGRFEVEDSAFGAVTFKSGATLVVKATWAANVKDVDSSLSLLLGINGGAELNNSDLVLNGESCNHLWQYKPEAFHNDESPYDREIAAWINAVENDKEPIVKAEQAAHVVKVLEAIYKSARAGGTAVTY
ncbi:MAG: Gfo/Idh/MocA family oxidoreductase [Clostridiales bacterium]|jgi:predicted dehydrogenase|nr:Gfo/Idh/MocA family oxidoreductase [Clostridiales bacterium]